MIAPAFDGVVGADPRRTAFFVARVLSRVPRAVDSPVASLFTVDASGGKTPFSKDRRTDQRTKEQIETYKNTKERKEHQNINNENINLKI